MRTLMAVVAVLVVALVAAGCTTMLDMDKAKESISSGITEQLGMQVSSVTCPESREGKADDTFECTAAIATGGTLKVTVTQKDDAGNIAWEVANAQMLVDLDALERVVKDGIREQTGLDAEIACDGRYRVAEPGKTFECSAKAPDSEATIVVTMNDDQGNVSWAIGPAK